MIMKKKIKCFALSFPLSLSLFFLSLPRSISHQSKTNQNEKTPRKKKSAEDGGLGVPSVALLISSTTKEGAWPALEKLAAEVGLPPPDVNKATFIAGAVGKNHFGHGGQQGEFFFFF